VGSPSFSVVNGESMTGSKKNGKAFAFRIMRTRKVGQRKLLETSAMHEGDFFTFVITQFSMKTSSDINMLLLDCELKIAVRGVWRQDF